ncbi:ras GTPase-activating protein-binding protein 2 [Culicoides brevitarsis]|uniref:ras GTPase-activating protein-binding protein 2 n=1 Tax=Culicoides brevitarsis TaxID=469753 RepID=UPI00307CC29D
MVMDLPTPQCVGREFVRQYYTLLNKAPDHLHRFYNNSSSFVHGGLDASNRNATTVVGQKQIHNKIQQLNFRDCHAKISQVDSQATLGGGVVVQVTGELSNSGMPMRRFTQTFVLAAQSPKKYYVHNDIFRYQDLYSEDDVEENGRSEADDEIPRADDDHSATQLINQQTIYYSSNVLTSAPNVLPDYGQQQATGPAAQQLNGHEEAAAAPVVVEESVVVEAEIVAAEPEMQRDPTPEPDVFESAAAAVEEKPEPVVAASNEPKTWSNLVKSGGMSSKVVPPPVANNVAAAAATPLPSSNKFPDSTRFDPPLGATGPGLSQKQSLPPRGNVQNRERRTSNTNTVPQNQQFNDNQQLFLGNIPHHASDEELKALFSRFGTVVDLRILSKQGQPKVPGQRPPPNYGFITYEDAAAVQECLANLPLYFPDNAPDGQKLNVEEKKTRTRAPGETGGRIGGGNYSNSLGGNTQRTLNNGLNNGQSNRNGPSNSSGLNRNTTQTRNNNNAGGGGTGGNLGGQNRGTFNRDRERQPLGQRNTGNASNSNNTYNRRN